MLTAIDTTGDDWWRQAMTEQEHDELERAFAEIMAEHEAQRDLVTVEFQMVRSEIADLIRDIQNGQATDRVVQMMMGALVERYLQEDIPAVDDDTVRDAVTHWMVENDPTIEDWDDDDEEWDIDDD